MTIATFADLKSQIATLLNRSNLTTQIPFFVQLAETRIAYGSQEQPLKSDPLRIRSMETSVDLALISGTQTVALPTGFLQQRRLYLSGTPIIKPQFVTPDAFWGRWFSYSSGQPVEYTVEGENYVFGPIPDAAYTGKSLYYKKFTALAGDSDTNWLLTNAPGVYLHGSLIEAYKYIRNMDQAAASLNNFCGVVNALNDADNADRHSTPWVSRLDIRTA